MNKKEFLSHTNDYLHEVFSLLLEKAYDAGYEQGKVDQIEASKTTIVKGGITWTKLDIPSKKVYGKFSQCYEPYNEEVNIPCMTDVDELMQYCRFKLIVDITRSTGTRWPSLYIQDAKGTLLKLWGFNYDSNPDGKVIDLWINDNNKQVTTSVLRLKVICIREYFEYDVEAEIISNVFKGENAVNLMIKE